MPACPKCGGEQVQTVDAQLVECISPVQSGLMTSPSGGLPVPTFQACGHRFQIGAATQSDTSCAFCGRVRLGNCEQCGQPICHTHGTSGDQFFCTRCWDQLSGAADQRARQATLEQEREQAAAAFDRCTTAEELIDFFEQHDDTNRYPAAVDSARIRQAWSTIAASGTIAPTHDLAGVAVKQAFLGRKWSEDGTRAALWQVGATGAFLSASGRTMVTADWDEKGTPLEGTPFLTIRARIVRNYTTSVAVRCDAPLRLRRLDRDLDEIEDAYFVRSQTARMESAELPRLVAQIRCVLGHGPAPKP